jgi:acetate kinase
MNVLVLNAGSSSLKFSLFDADREAVLSEGTADWQAHPATLTVSRPGQPAARTDLPPGAHTSAVQRILKELNAQVAAVGHRVVHGGSRYTASVRIDETVKTAIAELAELAPLHNPANLEGIRAAEAALPGVPQVAVFDTAFHATIPPSAHVYPVPYAWYAEQGVRRFGFHGLSHAYCTRRALEMLKRPAPGSRLIVCHLGNGCSASAVRDGRCVDTSMGFTPLEGLMMGTRSGSVDPGLLLHLLRRRGLTPEQLDRVLNQESGLLGVSGVSPDMREVLAAASAGNAQAKLALEIYAHRVRQTIGAMTATLGGVDALVFTAGVGENAATVRAMVCEGLSCLGINLDGQANQTCRPDADVGLGSSPVRLLVIHTREDLTIVRETVLVLSPSQ